MGYKEHIGKVIHRKAKNERGYKMQMTKEAREEYNAYQRTWRKNNPDKVRAINASYWERKAQRAKENNGDKEKDK